MKQKEQFKHAYDTQVNITLDYFLEEIEKQTENDFTFLIDVMLSDSKLLKGIGHNLPFNYNDASKSVEDFLKEYNDQLNKGRELNLKEHPYIYKLYEPTFYKYGIIYYYETIQESTEDKINIIKNKLQKGEDITPNKCIIDLEKNKQEFIKSNDLTYYDLKLIGIGSKPHLYFKCEIEPKLKKYFTPSGLKNIKSYYNKIPRITKNRPSNYQLITFQYVFDNRDIIYNHEEIKSFNDLLDFKINSLEPIKEQAENEILKYNINIDNKTYDKLNDLAIQLYNFSIDTLIQINDIFQSLEPITEEEKQLKEFINNKYNYLKYEKLITEYNKEIDILKAMQTSTLNGVIDNDFKQLIVLQYFNRNQTNHALKVEEQNQLQRVNDNTLIENIIFGNVYLEKITNSEDIKNYEFRKKEIEITNTYLQEDKKQLEQLKKQSRFTQTSFFNDDEPIINDKIQELQNNIIDHEKKINHNEKELNKIIVIYEGDKSNPIKMYYRPIYSQFNAQIKSIEDDTKRDAIKIVMCERVNTSEPNTNVIKFIPKKIVLNDKIYYANEYLSSDMITKLSAFTSALLRKASNDNPQIVFDIQELEHLTGINDQKNNVLRKKINIICEILRKTDLEEMQLSKYYKQEKKIEKLEDPKATIISAYSWCKKQLLIEIPSYLKQSKAIISSYYQQEKALILNKPEYEILHRTIASKMNNYFFNEEKEIKNQTFNLLNLFGKVIPKYFNISDRTKREISLIIEPIIEMLDFINNYTNYGVINWNKVKKEIENLTNYDAFSKYKIEIYVKTPHTKTKYEKLKLEQKEKKAKN